MNSSGAPIVLVVADRKPVNSGAWEGVLTDGLPSSYLSALEENGACPVLLPPSQIQIATAGRLLESADGLLLAGGRDIDAQQYGRLQHPSNDTPVAERDDLEIALTRLSYERGLPVLGTCRGMQVINVAFGGTLEQHLADRLDMTPHRDVVGHFTSHPIEVVAGTRLSEILGADHFDIASHHHQAVEHLGEGLRASATAPDGVIEAIETEDDRYLVGVQWHPEERLEREGNELLESFVVACIEYRRDSRSSSKGLQHV